MQNIYDADYVALTESRRDTYALLARLLRAEVSLELLRQLRKMLEGVHGSEAVGKGQILLEQYLHATESLDDNGVIGELTADYAGLFLNAGSTPVHPYESVYTSPEHVLMQQSCDQVRQIYAAAGLSRLGECREPEDHIALELEFMHHLCQCTVAAIGRGEAERAKEELQSQRVFLLNHLLLWAPQFCLDLVHNSTTDFYRAAGYLLCDFLELERGLMAEGGSI